MRKLFIIALALLCAKGGALLHAQQQVNWLTWEQAVDAVKKDRKKIVVDVYTDWCSWCKKMDQVTFQDPYIVQYLNQNFYTVKFNAQQQEDVRYNNRTYRFVRDGAKGYHELAIEITQGHLSYPTIVFLDEDFNVIQPINSYLDPLKFEQIMTYFGQNFHKKMPWMRYERSYKTLNANQKQ